MADPKTKVTNASVTDFISGVPNEKRRADGFALLEMFEEITGEKAKMWGPSIVGFGKYHFKSKRSSQEGDWPMVGFSPRKQSLTLYVISESNAIGDLLAQLGKHKTSKACLYINTLADVDKEVLKKIIKKAFVDMKKKHPIS